MATDRFVEQGLLHAFREMVREQLTAEMQEIAAPIISKAVDAAIKDLEISLQHTIDHSSMGEHLYTLQVKKQGLDK